MARVRSVVPLLAVLVLALPPVVARGKDNTVHILGLGFQQAPTDGPGPPALLSAKFAASPQAEFAALFGVDIGPDRTSVSVGGKAVAIVLPEEHLNVYLGATAYPTVGTRGLHHFSYFLGPGLAFYPPGLEHLEIFAEFGLGGSVALTSEAYPRQEERGTPFVATTGGVALGLHYWF